MKVKQALSSDIEAIMNIVNLAKNYFKKAGIDQWQNGYPNHESIQKDIDQGHLYVLKDDEKVVALAAIIFEPDPFYDVIEEGAWRSHGAYGVIHRVAVDPSYKGKNLAASFFDYAKEEAIVRHIPALRVDTHEDNLSMQRCIVKQGFMYRGIVYVDQHAKRYAYDYLIDFKDFLNHEKKQLYMNEVMAKVDEAYHHHPCFPPYDRLFYGLECSSYDDLKVVIMGQDPYHEENQAMGLAFSVCEGTPLPPSLVNIYKELNDDLGIDNGKHGDLTPWAKQGVLLMNDVLSVEKGKAHSHKDFGWQTFTQHLISFLNCHEQPLVFILWGNYAKKHARLIDQDKHCILSSAHPSPLSCYRGFFGSKPFSKTNDFLREHHRPTIDWRIGNQ